MAQTGDGIDLEPPAVGSHKVLDGNVVRSNLRPFSLRWQLSKNGL